VAVTVNDVVTKRTRHIVELTDTTARRYNTLGVDFTRQVA